MTESTACRAATTHVLCRNCSINFSAAAYPRMTRAARQFDVALDVGDDLTRLNHVSAN
jgi:hypothetical protein